MLNIQTQSPLDNFLEWFFSLPSTHQSQIAVAGHFMPGFALDFNAPDAANRLPELFANSVRKYKGRPSEVNLSERFHLLETLPLVVSGLQNKTEVTRWRTQDSYLSIRLCWDAGSGHENPI